MNWLESLLYGAVSGVTEFLPISSFAHQQILLKMFGETTANPVQSLLIHIALILSVFTGCRTSIEHLRRAQQSYRIRGLRNSAGILESRFLKNAALSLMVAYFVLMRLLSIKADMLTIAGFSLLNFLILLSQTRMMQGNKDERSMSFFDSIAVGISGASAVLPGVSRIGTMLTVGTVRGVDKEKLSNWVLLLSMPALLLLSLSDIIDIITTNGTATSVGFLGCVLSMVSAYGSGLFGIQVLKTATVRRDLSGFAFYSLGVTMFALFLYLSVV